MRQSNGEAARPGAYICYSQWRICFVAAPRAQAFERHFHNVLRLRPGNQDGRGDFELEPPEFLLAREVLRRLTRSATGDERKVFACCVSPERFFRMRVKPRAIVTERVHQKKLSGE